MASVHSMLNINQVDSSGDTISGKIVCSHDYYYLSNDDWRGESSSTLGEDMIPSYIPREGSNKAIRLVRSGIAPRSIY